MIIVVYHQAWEHSAVRRKGLSEARTPSMELESPGTLLRQDAGRERRRDGKQEGGVNKEEEKTWKEGKQRNWGETK